MTKAIRWSDQQLRAPVKGVGLKNPTPPLEKPHYPGNTSGNTTLEMPAKASKYRNRKVDLAGETFDSAKEARRWQVLQLQLAGGHIAELRRQVPFELAPAVRLAGEPRMKPALRYIADATYRRAGQLVVEDTKSAPTRKTGEYRIKKHLMKTVLNIDITEV